MKEYVIFNGNLIQKDEVLISPDNRGMMYGDGCFDTFRAYKGTFLHLEDHFNRTKAAAEFLGIKVVFDLDGFKAKIIELLEANNLLNEDAIVRVQCWRDGRRGYFTRSDEANWYTTSVPYSISKAPISLATVNVNTIPFEALDRRFKFSNGINYILAAKEAREKEADDVLMCTVDGKISETTIANIFWIKDNKLYTPALNCDLFPGITRKVLIGLIHEIIGLEINEGEFDPKEILKADAVFVTNSIREIVSVYRIDETKFDITHHLISVVEKLYSNYKNSNLN